MIITRLIGGLGNQMFQYAVGLALAKRRGVELAIDRSGFEQYSLRSYGLNHFNLEAREAPVNACISADRLTLFGRLQRRLGIGGVRGYRVYRESSLRFDNNVLTLPDNTYLDGYWQSEAYFLDHEDAIRQAFSFKNPASAINQEWLTNIKNGLSVAVHVRRGDYASNPQTNQVHGLCSLDYYIDAANYIAKKIGGAPTFYIFSDDPEWVKENLRFDYSVRYVIHNDAGQDYEDLRLMSACRHHIIANSSFSWWGAWLSEAKDQIIVAPKRWFASESLDSRDIVPKTWIKM